MTDLVQEHGVEFPEVIFRETIERTKEGVNYETVAIVDGVGTSSTPHSYSTIDESPFTGISYYRISQTDLDGAEKHLNTVVYTPCQDAESVNAFALNNNEIDVQINAAANEVYTITLMNAVGQIIYTQDHGASIGMNDYKIYRALAYGMYIMKVRDAQRVFTKKLILGKP